MPFKMFNKRLATHADIPPDDLKLLEDLPKEHRRLAAGAFVVREGAETRNCTVLTSGVALSHKIAGDGRRQIIGIYLPGELIDIDGLFLDRIDYNVQTITEAEIAVLDCAELLEFSFERPAIGKALLHEFVIRSAIAREWMVNLGTRDSLAKTAHLFCELSLRLALSSDDPHKGFELPINQGQVSDIIGVTPIHVGRVLKELEAEGLITREKRTIRILDWERLTSVGDFSPDYLQLPAAELPIPVPGKR